MAAVKGGRTLAELAQQYNSTLRRFALILSASRRVTRRSNHPTVMILLAQCPD